ncbi:Ferric reductase [Klebsormidium nitens]|uniref:Ferric reductase n=1 Tax=Klebsormidium nitens TaxID=105231 RepID=A0A1Y1ID53_KLENI|nr:Ferric reductase [Klebsormidium nitens]|eukprot:GAQ87872.1 Ferric reductase [Klebsormidium nitens]
MWSIELQRYARLQSIDPPALFASDQPAAKHRGSMVTMTESQKASPGQVPGPAILALRWFLLAVMGGLFVAWNFFWWARPTVWFGTNLLNKQWRADLDSGYFDLYDANYLLYFVPPVLIAILAPIYLSLPKPPRTEQDVIREAKPPSLLYRIWKFQVFQTVTVAELFWCTYVAAFLIWQAAVMYCKKYETIHRVPLVKPKKPPAPAWQGEWDYIAQLFGWASYILVNLLFFPVARNSPLLKLINVPWERAVRYHRWLAWWMLLMTLGHFVAYMTYWQKIGTVQKNVKDWRGYDVSRPAGILVGIVGAIMGLTSLGVVRRRYFELFFSVHQLYVLFILFLFWHQGTKNGLTFMMPSLFLFAFDRLQRAIQSWGHAGVLATKTLPDGTIQVEVAKHPNHAFHPLSFLFVNIPGVSRFEWHPFSLMTGPKDSARSFVFHVKPQTLGGTQWTDRATAKVGHVSPDPDAKAVSKCPLTRMLKADGFYGSESDSFKRYPALVMISGGSGIVPLIAVLRDILHSHRIGADVGLPSVIYLYWAVRDYRQLAPIAELSPGQLCPGHGSKVTIRVHAYVTQGTKSDVSTLDYSRVDVAEHSAVQPMRAQINGWRLSLVLLITLVGTTIFIGAAFNLIVYSYEKHGAKTGMRWWHRSSVLLCSIVAGVIVFGGLSMAAVYLLDNMLGRKEASDAVDAPAKDGYESSRASRCILEETADSEDNLLQAADVTFGQRPVPADILTEVAEQHAGMRIGVLASGPTELVHNVVSQCRRKNGIFTGGQNGAFFDLHTISYTL